MDDEKLIYRLQTKIRESEKKVQANWYKIEELLSNNRWILKDLLKEIKPLFDSRKYSPESIIIQDITTRIFEHTSSVAREASQKQSWNYSSIVQIIEKLLERILLDVINNE